MGKDSQHLGKPYVPKPVYHYTPVHSLHALPTHPLCCTLPCLALLCIKLHALPHTLCSTLFGHHPCVSLSEWAQQAARRQGHLRAATRACAARVTSAGMWTEAIHAGGGGPNCCSTRQAHVLQHTLRHMSNLKCLTSLRPHCCTQTRVCTHGCRRKRMTLRRATRDSELASCTTAANWRASAILISAMPSSDTHPRL